MQAGAGPKRMHWKMSIDLTHPVVASMGNLDPYDGMVTYSLLKALAERNGRICAQPFIGGLHMEY